MERNVGTRKDIETGEREYPVKREAGAARENPLPITAKRDEERRNSSEVWEFTPPRKAAIYSYVPVPQTDTGRRGENPQTDGRSVVKELGKMTP